MEKVAEETGTPLLDAHALLEQQADQQILGDYWLVDHIHPSFEGHRKIALALAEEMQGMGMLAPNVDLAELTREPFAEHFASLPASYFHEGQRMLEALRGWTQGKADGPPIESRFPNRVRPAVSSP